MGEDLNSRLETSHEVYEFQGKRYDLIPPATGHPKHLHRGPRATLDRQKHEHATISRAKLCHKSAHRSDLDLDNDLDPLTPQLLITHASVSVMSSSPGHLPGEEDRRFHYKERGSDCCHLWCDRGGVERVVVILLLGALLIIFSTVVLSLFYLKSLNNQGFNVVFPRDGQTPARSVEESHVTSGPPLPCSTSQCLNTAARINSISDPRSDPCSSFYETACGGWIGSRNITRPLDTISIVDEHRLNIDRKIKDLLEGLEENGRLDELGKLKTFYRSCTNEDLIRQRDKEPVVQFFRKHFKPALHPTQADKGDLTDVLKDLLLFGGSSLFEVSVDIHPFNNSKYITVIKLPSSTNLPSLHPLYNSLHNTKQSILHRSTSSSTFSSSRHNVPSQPRTFSFHSDLYSQRKVRDTREVRLKNFLSSEQLFKDIQAAGEAHSIGSLFKLVDQFNLLSEYSQPFKQTTADEIVGFIAALNKELPERLQELKAFRENRVYTLYNIQELQSLFKYVNWRRLLTGLIGNIDMDQQFMVHFPSHLRQIERVVSLFGVRVARLGVLVLFGRDFLGNLVSLHSNQERWRVCSQVSQILLPSPTTFLLVQSSGADQKDRIISKVKHVWSRVKRVLKDHIKETPWISRQSLGRVVKKLDKSRIQVDLPVLYTDRSSVLQTIKNINISQNYFENAITLMSSRRRNIFSLIRKSVEGEDCSWSLLSSPLSINAFYIRQINSVVVPFGLLSGFLQYLPNLPPYISDAQISFVLAHELLHSVDPTGLGWDENGKLSDIFDPVSLSRYENKLECLEISANTASSQEESYQGRRVRLNTKPEVTVAETLCDVEAVKIVSRMFDMTPRIGGSTFTPEQLLYLNIAQGFCGVMGTAAKVIHLHLSPHSLSRQRIDNLAMFSRQFSTAFQCPVGSRLNPPNSCVVFGSRVNQ